MSIDVGGFAPYLKDPLTLIGFVVLVTFWLFGLIVRQEIIPQLSRRDGYSLVTRLVNFGMIVAMAIIVLGFGLKYGEMSSDEHRRVMQLLEEEVGANDGTLNELVLNTDHILNHFLVIATIIRDERIPVIEAMFPSTNLSSDVGNPDISELVGEAGARLVESGLLESDQELMKANEAAVAIRSTIERVQVVLDMLADDDGKRYVIEEEVLSQHMNILRRLDEYDISGLQSHYSEWRTVRRNYDVVVGYVLEYFNEVARYMNPEEDVFRKGELRSVLTAERLAYSTILTYGKQLATAAEAADGLTFGD